MKQLSKIETILFVLGGILLVAGVGLYVFGIMPPISALTTLVGAILFAGIQVRQTYLGNSITIKRLKTILNIASVMFILSAMCMCENVYQLLLPFFNQSVGSYTTYVKTFHNNWVVFLLIAVVLEVYAMHRIESELKKDKTI